MVTPRKSFLDFESIRMMTDEEIQRYITDVNEEEKRQAFILWREHSRRPDLIAFEEGTNRQYTYDQAEMKYYETTGGRKREIPYSSIRMDVDYFSQEMANMQKQLAADLVAGKITPQQWYDESARLMKLSYYAIIVIARGGSDNLDSNESYWWLLLLLALFLVLNGTAELLLSGEIPINGHFANMHANRGRVIKGLIEDWKRRQATLFGYDEERSFLTPADHCHASDHPGCVEEAARGWVPIGTLSRIGDRTCRSNCRCYMRYRKSNGSKPRRVL